MNIIIVVICAIIGSLAAAAIGWLDSGEPFDLRRFAKSFITAVIAGVVFASTFDYTKVLPLPMLIILAFLGGVGVDYMSKKAAGVLSIGKLSRPPTP